MTTEKMAPDFIMPRIRGSRNYKKTKLWIAEHHKLKSTAFVLFEHYRKPLLFDGMTEAIVFACKCYAPADPVRLFLTKDGVNSNARESSGMRMCNFSRNRSHG